MKRILLAAILFCGMAGTAQPNYFDGTSITAGAMVSSSQRFSTLYDKSAKNIATSGSCMEAKKPEYVKSGFNKIGALPKYTGGYFFVEYGGNDILFNTPYSTAAFMKAYTAYINKLVANGWPRNRIIVFYNYFIPAKGIAYYSKLFGTRIPDNNRINKYNAAIVQTIKSNKVDSFDIGSVILNVPLPDANKVWSSDGLHPSAVGHKYVYLALAGKMKAKADTTKK